MWPWFTNCNYFQKSWSTIWIILEIFWWCKDCAWIFSFSIARLPRQVVTVASLLRVIDIDLFYCVLHCIDHYVYKYIEVDVSSIFKWYNITCYNIATSNEPGKSCWIFFLVKVKRCDFWVWIVCYNNIWSFYPNRWWR